MRGLGKAASEPGPEWGRDLRQGRAPRGVRQVQEGEGERARVAGLRLQRAIADRAAVQPRRRPGLQAAQREARRVQRGRQRACAARAGPVSERRLCAPLLACV